MTWLDFEGQAVADCHHNGGCAVNGTAVAAVWIDQSRSFMNLHIWYVHSIAARLPICEIWGFVANTWQHLPHLLLEVYNVNIPVYGVFLNVTSTFLYRS